MKFKTLKGGNALSGDVSQCLNVDVSSFGKTVQEAIFNLNEALALYFEDKKAIFTITPIQETLLGETRIHI